MQRGDLPRVLCGFVSCVGGETDGSESENKTCVLIHFLSSDSSRLVEHQNWSENLPVNGTGQQTSQTNRSSKETQTLEGGRPLEPVDVDDLEMINKVIVVFRDTSEANC